MTDLPAVRRELDALGFCHLQRLSQLESTEILNSFGSVLHTTDVLLDPTCTALVTSDRALDLHTDHSRVRYVAWYCLRPTDIGGISLLLDSWPLIGAMSERERAALCEIRLFEHRVFENDPEYCPMLRYLEGQPQLYYSFRLCNEEDREVLALRKFRNLIEQASVMGIRLAANDLLIVDNRRMLHGRTRIEGRKDRHLERYWIE